MANDNFDKLIARALWEDASPREELADKLELCIDRQSRMRSLRRRRLEWIMGGIAASVLVAGIALTGTYRSDKFYSRDTFDDPQEAAQFMSSVLGGVSRQLNKGIERSLDEFMNGISIINESTNNQKSNENEC